MRSHVLFFQRPQFHAGLNLTVRLSAKWYTQADCGDELSLVDLGEEKEILRGEVVETTYSRFDAIPESWLKYEHDPSCRDRGGLYAELCRIYAESMHERPYDLDEGTRTVVSCILFTVPQAYPPAKAESDIMIDALDRPKRPPYWEAEKDSKVMAKWTEGSPAAPKKNP